MALGPDCADPNSPNGFFQCLDTVYGTAAQAPSLHVAKHTFYGIQPRAAGGRVVNVESGSPLSCWPCVRQHTDDELMSNLPFSKREAVFKASKRTDTDRGANRPAGASQRRHRAKFIDDTLVLAALPSESQRGLVLRPTLP
jgi:hypothetical protein